MTEYLLSKVQETNLALDFRFNVPLWSYENISNFSDLTILFIFFLELGTDELCYSKFEGYQNDSQRHEIGSQRNEK